MSGDDRRGLRARVDRREARRWIGSLKGDGAMKYWMAFSLAVLAVGCSNQKNTRPATPAPAREPVSTTTVTTTSAALTVTPSMAEPDTGNARLTNRIRQHLNIDRALD